MAAQPKPLSWVLRRPLRQPSRLVAIVILSTAISALRALSLTAALYPVLKILFDDAWRAELTEVVDHLPAIVQPLAAALVEFLTSGTPLAALGWLLGGAFAMTLIRAVLQWFQERLTSQLVHSTAEGVAIELHGAILDGAGDDHREGDLLVRFTADLDALRQALRRLLGKVLREPFHLVTSLTLLVWIDAELALWIGLVFPVTAGALLVIARRLRDVARQSLGQTGELVSLVEQGLRGRRVVRAFGLEQRESQRFAEVQRRLTDNLRRLDVREALSSPLLELLASLAAALCIVLGASRALAQPPQLDAEALLTFYFVLGSLLDPLRKLADTHVRVQRARAAAGRLLDVITSRPTTPPVRGEQPLPDPAGRLEIDSVSVLTADGKPILADVSLAADPGQIVLIAGASGAGKSTLLDLVAGLREPDQGTVRLGGIAYADLDAEAFRGRLGMVTQETFLFAGSIASNVTLGRPPRSISLEDALAAAGLDERIEQLERGVDTPTEAVALSAGERQRLAIARALYLEPALLLLDEATSALDRPREREILAAVFAARAHRITLLVTHRLEPVLDADAAVLLADGRVVATGSPRKLLRSSTGFRNLAEGESDS